LSTAPSPPRGSQRQGGTPASEIALALVALGEPCANLAALYRALSVEWPRAVMHFPNSNCSRGVPVVDLGPGLNDDPDPDLLGACLRRMTELALPGLRLAV